LHNGWMSNEVWPIYQRIAFGEVAYRLRHLKSWFFTFPRIVEGWKNGWNPIVWLPHLQLC
jgi:hypothetical protein